MPRVSTYRMAGHLATAFTIFSALVSGLIILDLLPPGGSLYFHHLLRAGAWFDLSLYLFSCPLHFHHLLCAGA